MAQEQARQGMVEGIQDTVPAPDHVDGEEPVDENEHAGEGEGSSSVQYLLR